MTEKEVMMLEKDRAKGNHRMYKHPNVPGVRVVLSEHSDEDAKPYQEADVEWAVAATYHYLGGRQPTKLEHSDDSSNDGVEDEGLVSLPFTEDELSEARRYSLHIQWSPEQDLYMATSPEFPQVRTHGATQEEALAMGVEVIALWLSALRDDGETIPSPNYFYLKPQ